MIRLNARTGFDGIRGKVKFPEQKETKTGSKFLKFQISTYNGKNRETGKGEYSNWACTAWGDVWIPEGTLLLVTECAIRNRKYEDEDGKKKSVVDITVYRCEEIPEDSFFSGGRTESSSFTPLERVPAVPVDTTPALDDGRPYPEYSGEQQMFPKTGADDFLTIDDDDIPF